jgi:transcriptional regulator with XRE-family HTH domain
MCAMTETRHVAADRVREFLTRQRLTQRELAFFAGCSNTAVSLIEKGRLEPSASLKAGLAKALGVSVQQLWAVA